MSFWEEIAQARAQLEIEATARQIERKKRIADISADKGEKQSPVSSPPPVPPDEEISLGTVADPSAATVAEHCIDTLEWLLGLERMTEEQEEYAARIETKYATLISTRKKLPYLDKLGIPRIPSDCEPEYRHWEGGQPLLDTLLELGASDRAVDMRVTEEYSPGDWWRWQEIRAKRQE